MISTLLSRQHFSRRGSTMFYVLLAAVLGLLVGVVSPAVAAGTLNSSVGGTTTSTLGDEGRDTPQAGEQACVEYASTAYELVFDSGTINEGSATYNAGSSPVEFLVNGSTPWRFEGPAGSYNPNDPNEVTATGCVTTYAGQTALTYNVGTINVAGLGADPTSDADDVSCQSAAPTGSSVKRAGGTITLFLNDVNCTIGTVAFTQDVTVVAYLQKVGPLTVCNSPIAPVECKIATATASFA